MNWRVMQLKKKKWKILGNYFLIVGVISSFVTIITAICSNVSTLFTGYEAVFLIALFLGVFVLAIGWDIKLLFEEIIFKVTKKIEMKISVGSILEKNGNIIIPVNEYFDTIVDEKVISSKTLHGQFILNCFGGNHEELQKKIGEELKNKESKRGYNEKNKYPLGTIVKVNKKGINYFLVALSKFDEDHKAHLDMNEYKTVLESLFSFIHKYSQGERVHLPLIGSGQSGIELTEQEILENLIYFLKLREDITASGGIEVVIYSKDIEKIDLERVRLIVNE